ncbi:MAG: ATP-binding protein [Methanolobus sp.]
MLFHFLIVKGLEKELETETMKNEESEKTLLLKYRIEKTLSKISSFLSFSENLDEKIDESLGMLGNLCKADRVYIFKITPDGELVNNTHEWCADGVEAQKDKLQNLPVSQYEWWNRKLSEDGAVHIKSLDDLPPEAEAEKKLLESQDIKSLIVLPFNLEGELAGFIGFDYITKIGGWNEEHIEVLKTFANIVAMAFKRKMVTSELNREREQLLSVFDSMEDLIYVSDPVTHEILYINEVLRNLAGKDISGEKCYKALQGFDFPCNFCTNPIILENRDETHYWEYHNPLTSKAYAISDRIIKWPDGRDVRLEIAHDITDIRETESALKEKEEELRKSNQRLIEINTELSKVNDEMYSLDEMKSNFLSTMSHELKTPLISIMGFSELVGDEVLGPLNKEQKKAMNLVNSNSSQLKRLIESLLFMSSMGAKNYNYDFDDMPIKPIIENALEIISMENKDKKLTVENQLPEEHYFVHGDLNYLSEMFIHIIDNAFKFTPSDGKVSICAILKDSSLHIVIEDTGIGIPENKITKTFDSFYQLDGSLSRRYNGAGIGLNICKRIAEDHGGKLWIESTEGLGTKVHIMLPAQKKLPSY